MTQQQLHDLAERLVAQGRMPTLSQIGNAVKGAQPFAAVSSYDQDHPLDPKSAQKLLADAAHKSLEGSTPDGVSGLGYWEGTAEPTRILPGYSRRDVAALAKRFRQKAFVYFQPGDGTATHYHLFGARVDPVKVAETLQAAGVPGYSVTPDGTAHVIDHGGELADAVHVAARTLGARVASQKGVVEFPGHDDRAEAARVYDKIISGEDA